MSVLPDIGPSRSFTYPEETTATPPIEATPPLNLPAKASAKGKGKKRGHYSGYRKGVIINELIKRIEADIEATAELLCGWTPDELRKHISTGVWNKKKMRAVNSWNASVSLAHTIYQQGEILTNLLLRD